MASSEITLEAVPSASDIPAAEWDACANPKADPTASKTSTRWLHPGVAGDSCLDSRVGYNPSFPMPFSPRRKPPDRPAPAPLGPAASLARLDAGSRGCSLLSEIAFAGEYVFDRGGRTPMSARWRITQSYRPRCRLRPRPARGSDPRRRRPRANRCGAGERADGALQCHQCLLRDT